MNSLPDETFSTPSLASDKSMVTPIESRGRGWQGFDVLRILLGFVLLAAAGLKGYELATSPVAETSWFTARWFLILAVEFELLLGLWLLSGLWREALWWVTILCFSIFASITLYRALDGADSCGCFGKLTIHPWVTFGFDVVVIAALLAFPPSPRQSPISFQVWRLAAVVGLALVIGVPGGVVMASYRPVTFGDDGVLGIDGTGGTVVLKLEDWVDRVLPLGNHIDIGSQLREGDWTLVLYRHDCPACRQSLPRYDRVAQAWAHQGGKQRLALIELAPYASSHGHADPVSEQTAVWRGKLSDQHKWFVSVPSSLDLRNGVVTATPSVQLAEAESHTSNQ